MKFYVTGSTRGLGKCLAKHFDCTTVDRPIDLIDDIDDVIDMFEDGDCVILNAHANQLEYVNRLRDKCRLVVMGSLAAVHPDSSMPEYSQDKSQLEQEVVKYSVHSKYPILYLRLTSSSYKNHKMIIRSIKFWLDHPDINFIGYNIND
jgi:hypothetical protein